MLNWFLRGLTSAWTKLLLTTACRTAEVMVKVYYVRRTLVSEKKIRTNSSVLYYK